MVFGGGRGGEGVSVFSGDGENGVGEWGRKNKTHKHNGMV